MASAKVAIFSILLLLKRYCDVPSPCRCFSFYLQLLFCKLFSLLGASFAQTFISTSNKNKKASSSLYLAFEKSFLIYEILYAWNKYIFAKYCPT